MGIDLDCAATFGDILTIFGDTLALLSELSEKNEENEDENKSGCNYKDNSEKKNKDSDKENSKDNCDEGGNGENGVFVGTFISFIGDLIEAVVGCLQARQEYGDNIPKYVERGLLGGWLVVIGDILQLQALIAEENEKQENQALELSLA